MLGKVTECNIDTQKSIVFVFTNNSMAEKELVSSIPSVIAAKINTLK